MVRSTEVHIHSYQYILNLSEIIFSSQTHRKHIYCQNINLLNFTEIYMQIKYNLIPLWDHIWSLHFFSQAHLSLTCLSQLQVSANSLIILCKLTTIPSLNIFLSSVQLLSCVSLFATLWIEAYQASLSITNSWSLLRLASIESVMPSSHLILCRPLLLLPPIPPSIRDFSNESTLRMRWPKYRSFSFSIIPSKEHPGLISFRMDWLDFLAVQGTLKSL